MNTPSQSKKITTVARIVALAKSGRTVIRRMNWNRWRIMPAVFVANWPASYLSRSIQFGDIRETSAN